MVTTLSQCPIWILSLCGNIFLGCILCPPFLWFIFFHLVTIWLFHILFISLSPSPPDCELLHRREVASLICIHRAWLMVGYKISMKWMSVTMFLHWFMMNIYAYKICIRAVELIVQHLLYRNCSWNTPTTSNRGHGPQLRLPGPERPALLCTTCVFLGKLILVSEPLFSHLPNEDSNEGNSQHF